MILQTTTDPQTFLSFWMETIRPGFDTTVSREDVDPEWNEEEKNRDEVCVARIVTAVFKPETERMEVTLEIDETVRFPKKDVPGEWEVFPTPGNVVRSMLAALGVFDQTFFLDGKTYEVEDDGSYAIGRNTEAEERARRKETVAIRRRSNSLRLK